MGKNNDREHFDSYRVQTQAKHAILEAYLPAYFNILKVRNKDLLYIDGFAGRGTYTNSETGELVDGSPLRALKLIAGNDDFRDKVSTVFIESDKALFAALSKSVTDFHAKNAKIRKPECMYGTFAERVADVLKVVEGKLAPTFLFVDPCGVDGTSFETIRAVMDCDKCESFIFFNIDGVRRIAGLDTVSQVLVNLMGSKGRANELYDALRTNNDPFQREQLILSHYRRALTDDIGADYIVPFRVESEDKQKTSHYLIHATKHPLGFRIMKDVMWRRGRTENQAGALEFVQASRTNFIPLFNVRGDAVKQEILDELSNGARRVSVFREEWVCRANDMLCETEYKNALIELEADGKVEVLDKEGRNVVGAIGRPKRNGAPTLAKEYYVRLPNRAKG